MTAIVGLVIVLVYVGFFIYLVDKTLVGNNTSKHHMLYVVMMIFWVIAGAGGVLEWVTQQ